jgi:energy-coupling factor transport system permease protein
LLVLAIRHGDRMALSMDARAFGSGPRTRYREVCWQARDLYLALGAGVALATSLWIGAVG